MKKSFTNCYKDRAYERTELGLCYRIYYSQCRNSKIRGHNKPQYSKEELASWVMSQENFTQLYSDWVESNYTTDFKPSCDRLDNSKGYSFDNIELVTFLENKQRAHKDTINGELGSSQVEVFQYTLDGKFKQKYQSMNAAASSEDTLDQRNISACCRGTIPTAYNYYWSYYDLGQQIPSIKSNDDYLREIVQYDAITREIINVYESILDIPESKFSHMKIRAVIRGDEYTHKGSYWSFDFMGPDDFEVNTKYLPKLVAQYKDGALVATYNSTSEAFKKTGIRSGNISKVCNGRAKSAGGFTWKYTTKD